MYRPERRSAAETRRHPAEMLKDILGAESRRINEMLQREGLSGNLLNRDGSLDPEGYAGMYSDDMLQRDKDFVRQREVDFSSARNPRVQDFYREKHGARTEEEIVRQRRENKSREKNGQMEMAVTALLSRALGNDFVVVRTAPFDDYKNGVDNLILDRVTGEVVGAFDEVHEGGIGERTGKKQEKIQKVAEQGGARIRYGLKLENGKVVRASLEGVPLFYLGLDSEELTELIEGLGSNDHGKTSRIFKKLLASLEVQRAGLEGSARSQGFRSKLHSFGQSLSRLMAAEEPAAA